MDPENPKTMMNRYSGSERRILGMSPISLVITFLSMSTLLWYLKSCNSEVGILQNKYETSLGELRKLSTKLASTEKKVKIANNKVTTFEESNRELVLKLTKADEAQSNLKGENSNCERRLDKNHLFFIKMRTELDLSPFTGKEVTDVATKEIEDKVKSLKADQLRCVNVTTVHGELMKAHTKLQSDFNAIVETNKQLEEQVQGLSKLRDELQEKVDSAEIETNQRNVQQKKKVTQPENVKMIDHNKKKENELDEQKQQQQQQQMLKTTEESKNEGKENSNVEDAKKNDTVTVKPDDHENNNNNITSPPENESNPSNKSITAKNVDEKEAKVQGNGVKPIGLQPKVDFGDHSDTRGSKVDAADAGWNEEDADFDENLK